MRFAIRFVALAVLVAGRPPSVAAQGDVLAAIRADRWADAEAAAAGYADPVAEKLVLYYRLMAPGAARAAEIAEFMAQNPDWPNRALLERRRQEALAADPDQVSVLRQCDRPATRPAPPPTIPLAARPTNPVAVVATPAPALMPTIPAAPEPTNPATIPPKAPAAPTATASAPAPAAPATISPTAPAAPQPTDSTVAPTSPAAPPPTTAPAALSPTTTPASPPTTAAPPPRGISGLPSLPGALLRCAAALATDGRIAEATEAARRAWLTGITDAGAETAFLHRWGGVPTPDDQWARFQALAWSDPAAAARQAVRLDPAHRPAAEARLALKRDDPSAFAMVAALAAAQRSDPGLMLDEARWLRRANRDNEAVALWQSKGTAAQRAAPAEHLAAFWTERSVLARRRLRDGDPASAYGIAAAHGQTAPEPASDAEFLAGFIALRRLNDPARATGHFEQIAALSKSAISASRAGYWLGRAALAAGRDPRPDFERAAAWPTTFYGQLAALALGDDAPALAHRIAALRDPGFSHDQALDFIGRDVVRAAALLVAWGDPHRARSFLLRMDELSPDPADRSMVAQLALGFGLPDTAVSVGRRMGRDGMVLPGSGWPMPFDPPAPLDPAVALGIMRQESNFDIGAVSPSGARGLMQLMPATAQAVAKQLGTPVSIPALTVDPTQNMQLGATYLEGLLDRFQGSLPLAVAGYNAGPHRVDQWLAENGDPRSIEGVKPEIEMIDWIELIPIGETRNYVQRVLENVTIYRARRGEATPTLLAHWSQ
jgi:soluble lytic murein transglycosylase